MPTIGSQVLDPVKCMREKRIELNAKMHEHSELVAAANENVRQVSEQFIAINKDLQANEYALKMMLVIIMEMVERFTLNQNRLTNPFRNFPARKTQTAEQRRHNHCDAKRSTAAGAGQRVR